MLAVMGQTIRVVGGKPPTPPLASRSYELEADSVKQEGPQILVSKVKSLVKLVGTTRTTLGIYLARANPIQCSLFPEG